MTLVLLALLGCDRTATVAEGAYALVEVRRADGTVEVPEAAPELVVDGLVVRLGDDEADATPWPRADWPEGCPTQVGVAHQETWQLSAGLSPGEGLVFAAPVLVAGCGADSGPATELLLVDGEPDPFEPCGGQTCARYRQSSD